MQKSELIIIVLAVLLIVFCSFLCVSQLNSQKQSASNNAQTNQATNSNNQIQQPNSNNQQSFTSTTTQEAKPIPSDWKVYENKDLGFKISYPDDLKEIESSPDNTKVVNFINAETIKYAEDHKKELTDFYKTTSMDGYFNSHSNIGIYFYNSIKEAHGTDTIQDFIKSNSEEISKIGEMQIDGASAIETIQQGESSNFVILFQNKGYYYEIQLNNIPNKKSISEIQKQMISSFRFIN